VTATNAIKITATHPPGRPPRPSASQENSHD